MSVRELIIEGARQNNLKNISIRIPHDKVIAVTGVSGSGKSSLAFDTIFAEGQWRFIESISTYARLFIEKLDRPDVDAIYNIRPAIALEQRNPVRGSRSTVGTLTEIYDFLRLLYSKVSTPFCPNCGKEIRKWDPSQIYEFLIEGCRGKKALVLFETDEAPDSLRKRGFYRVLVDKEVGTPQGRGSSGNPDVVDLSELKDIPARLNIVLDRLIIRDEARLSDSIEMAWREGGERLKIFLVDDERMLKFSSQNACDDCNIEVPEPSPLLFSFNHPVGACPECKGFGNVLVYDEDLVVPDKYLSLSEGAIEPWEKPSYRWWKRQMIEGAKRTGIDVKRPYRELSEEDRKRIFNGDSGFYGVKDFFEELEGKRYKLHVRVFLSRYRSAKVCPACKGKRLHRNALVYKINGLDIAELCEFSVSNLSGFFRDLDLSSFRMEMVKDVLRQIEMKLRFLERVGLDYLTLSRQGRTLSGGEYQRVNLSNQIASYLTGTLYVLDEPTVGLHARDTERISRIMAELSGIGNTIIVVEHDRKIIESADWIIELGPGGGDRGGNIVFSGTKEEFLKTDTVTSRYIKGLDRIEVKRKGCLSVMEKREPVQYIVLHGAKGNNLKNVDLRIPLNRLIAVTGVSGSGKSSLIVETLYRALARHFAIGMEKPLPFDYIEGINLIKGLRLIDQTPIGRSPRSNPVTYLKVFDPIRRLYAEQPEARAYGFGPGHFSFNTKGGRCERCKGEGYEKLEMYFFEDIYVRCEECNGKRYNPDVLKVTFRGRNISDVLNMTVEEAIDLFHEYPAITDRLSVLNEIGLGYLRLGQSATTLSGGEAQRLKICSELSFGRRRGILYILDEPTVGLHFKDVTLLLNILRRLVDSGSTVIVIEHNLDVINASDWIIDLGPEGGDKGGEIIFEGTPEDIIKAEMSYTGRYLRQI